MKDLKNLKEKLKSYNDKDITVRTDGSLRFLMPINKVQAMVTNKVILIGNSDLVKNEEIEILVDDINNIETDAEITLYMNGNYIIYISK